MKRPISGAIVFAYIVIVLLSYSVQGNSSWEELEELGNQNFSVGEELLSNGNTSGAVDEFMAAARMFNESGQLALHAGSPADAKRIFSKLGRCFSAERVDDPELLNSYANSTAFAYLEAARDETFANASDYLRRAGYLFSYHGLETLLSSVVEAYTSLLLSEVDRAREVADLAASEGAWDVAGLNYMDAAVMLYSLGDERAGELFGMATSNFVQGAEEALTGSTPANKSRAGFLFRLAALSDLSMSSGHDFNLQKAGDAFSLAADGYLSAGDLSDAKDNLIWAGEMYERAGTVALSVESRIEAANILVDLVPNETETDYLLALQAGILYDLTGSHEMASMAYTTAISPSVFPFDMVDYFPKMQLELLEILGRGRRTNRARAISDLLLSRGNNVISFFGAPTFGGYDVMGELGFGILEESADSLFYSTYVSESLLLASSFLVNFLTEEAQSILDSIPEAVLITDPGNKAFHELLIAVARNQAGFSTSFEFEEKMRIFEDLFQGAFVSSLDDILPNPIYVPHPRREAALKVVLDDLAFVVTNNKPAELLYDEAQELSDELASSNTRNLTGNTILADVWSIIGRRSSHQGDTNASANLYSLAAFHSCAGEDFQKALLYQDIAYGMVDANTPLSAASYVTADAMLSENQTLKDQAKDYILGNLTIYIGDQNAAILISVLEGRTKLGGISSIDRMAGLGLIAGFVLITSYIILIWEPKQTPASDGESNVLEKREPAETVGEAEHLVTEITETEEKDPE